MAAAPVESCQFVVLRSPRGRLGSVLDVRKRLHRTRGGFHRCIHISKVLCALLLWTMICQQIGDAEAVKELLSSGVDPLATGAPGDWNDDTPAIHHCIDYAQPACLEALLATGNLELLDQKDKNREIFFNGGNLGCRRSRRWRMSGARFLYAIEARLAYFVVRGGNVKQGTPDDPTRPC